MKNPVPLHVHSEYSLLESTLRIKDIVRYASSMSLESAAITDTMSLSGAFKFFSECRKENIKPIIGCELIISPYENIFSSNDTLVVLAENEEGYRNLSSLLSKYCVSGKESVIKDISVLKDYSSSLICLTGGTDGFLSKALTDGSTEEAENYLLTLISVFPKNNVYIELTDAPSYSAVLNPKLELLSEKFSLKTAACGNIRIYEENELRYLDVLSKIKNPDHEASFSSVSYFKNIPSYFSVFEKYKYAIENTSEISNRCRFEFDTSAFHLPEYEDLGEFETDREMLLSLSLESLAGLVKSDPYVRENEKKYRERVDSEFEVISKMGFCSYFLIVRDFIKYAKDSSIEVGPGRGSGCGSLIAYLISITEIDPIKYNLIFERFLNPDRVTMPDFDVDFCYQNRYKVIDYVTRKYTPERTSQIITFGTLSSKAVIRDVSKALDIDSYTSEIVIDRINQSPGSRISDLMKEDETLKSLYANIEKLKLLLDTASFIEGMPKYISTHAAGVLISDRAICDYMPTVKNGNVTLTQFDMDDLTSLGLLKFDFLAIKYLTLISKASEYVRMNNPSFDITKIDIEDKNVYRFLSKGNTDYVFQLDSFGMKKLLRRFKPESLKDLMAVLSLYRPGPMASIDEFIARRNNPSLIAYENEDLREILSETSGIILYQEQVMAIFRKIAGYTFAHADVVRRAISKKKADVLMSEREAFVSGAAERGYDREFAERLFKSIEDFASYAFNKSHACAYSVFAFRTAYLKCYYPSEYYAAVFSVMSYDKSLYESVYNELKNSNRSFLRPDINMSGIDFQPEGMNIRFGLLSADGVNSSLALDIILERNKNGPYKDITDFAVRLSGFRYTSSQIEKLALCGALDSICENRKQAVDFINSRVSSSSSSAPADQLSMFSLSEVESSEKDENEISPEDFGISEKITLENEIIGFPFSSVRARPLKETEKQAPEEKKEEKIFLKIDTSDEPLFKRLKGLLSIFDGKTAVIIFDSNSCKYLRNDIYYCSGSEFLINELRSLLGEDNVVIK